MNPRSLERIRFRLSQDLARDRRGIALAKCEELEQVGNRISFGPAEVRVRNLTGFISYVEQESRDRVGNRRADAAQDVMAVHVHAAHDEVAAELGRVTKPHLEEQHAIARRQMMRL